MRKMKWPLLLALTATLMLAFIWGTPAVRFPLALGLIRIAFFVTENVWKRARPAGTPLAA